MSYILQDCGECKLVGKATGVDVRINLRYLIERLMEGYEFRYLRYLLRAGSVQSLVTVGDSKKS